MSTQKQDDEAERGRQAADRVLARSWAWWLWCLRPHGHAMEVADGFCTRACKLCGLVDVEHVGVGEGRCEECKTQACEACCGRGCVQAKRCIECGGSGLDGTESGSAVSIFRSGYVRRAWRLAQTRRRDVAAVRFIVTGAAALALCCGFWLLHEARSVFVWERSAWSYVNR